MRYNVDPIHLYKARQHLGIYYPVRVLQRKMKHAGGRYYGRETYDGYKTRHLVTVCSDYHSCLIASQVLWHELMHCKQNERYGEVNFNKLYDEQLHELGLERKKAIRQGKPLDLKYTEIALEQEAIACEKNVWDFDLLFNFRK